MVERDRCAVGAVRARGVHTSVHTTPEGVGSRLAFRVPECYEKDTMKVGALVVLFLILGVGVAAGIKTSRTKTVARTVTLPVRTVTRTIVKTKVRRVVRMRTVVAPARTVYVRTPSSDSPIQPLPTPPSCLPYNC
jgi:hypothetical protein